MRTSVLILTPRRRTALALPFHKLLVIVLVFVLGLTTPSVCASGSTPWGASSVRTVPVVGRTGRRGQGRRMEDRKNLPPPPTTLNISIVTWNMAERSPPLSDVSLVASAAQLNTSDLCILGVQEIENLKPRRHEGSRSREWRRLILHSLGRTHTLLSLTKLGGMQLAVLAKKALLPHLSPLHVCEVPCGVGNIIHNKGGQAALFRVGPHTSFLFINAHLAAHAHRVEDRNADVDRVMTELQNLLWYHLESNKKKKKTLPFSSSPLPSSPIQYQHHHPPAPSALLDKVDRLFFLGDLNYRLELQREDIEVPLRRVKNSKITVQEAVSRLLEYDQLMIERLEKKRVFQGLVEKEVCFLPTFKFNKGRDLYDTSPKKRAPAWTDRVLFKPCEGKVKCEKYESVGGARHSDHRPVVGVFTVQLEEEEVLKKGGKKEEVPTYGKEDEGKGSDMEMGGNWKIERKVSSSLSMAEEEEGEEEEDEEEDEEGEEEKEEAGLIEEEEDEEYDDDSEYGSDDEEEEEEDDDDSDFF
ncbi:hypothetical protein VYU27_006980 [Nannochloropsis oceanica]